MNFAPLMLLFSPLFSRPVWHSAMVLVSGAILAPGKRTVSAALRAMGLAEAANYQTYHRVLNRAVWLSRKASFIATFNFLWALRQIPQSVYIRSTAPPQASGSTL
ncbi:MAG: hypothetical protein ACFE0J_10170 [Elainellaceae cyanobacterium]